MRQHDIASAIKAASIRLEILQAFADLTAVDAKQAADLAGELSRVYAATSLKDSAESGSQTRFKRLVSWFVESGNRPAVKPEIQDALGISSGSLHSLLYTEAPKGALTTRPNPDGGKRRLIALSPEFYQQAIR
jgi:hypothetical protein